MSPQPEPLRRAIQNRSQAKHAAAESAIARRRRTGEVINFNTIAAEADCTPRYLYTQPDLREAITKLRQAPTSQTPPEANTDTGIVAALRVQLRRKDGELADLRANLEIARGRIIELENILTGSRSHD